MDYSEMPFFYLYWTRPGDSWEVLINGARSISSFKPTKLKFLDL